MHDPKQYRRWVSLFAVNYSVQSLGENDFSISTDRVVVSMPIPIELDDSSSELWIAIDPTSRTLSGKH